MSPLTPLPCHMGSGLPCKFNYHSSKVRFSTCIEEEINYEPLHTHARLRARAYYASSTLIGGKGGAAPRSLHTTFEGPNGVSMWMQDGCKVYMNSYMASIASCFMVTWTICENRLLEVGLTQSHWETMALWMLTTVELFYFCHGWG